MCVRLGRTRRGERRTRAGGLSATRAFLSPPPPTRAERPAERLGPPSPALYACAAAVNFALRVSWSLQLSALHARRPGLVLAAGARARATRALDRLAVRAGALGPRRWFQVRTLKVLSQATSKDNEKRKTIFLFIRFVMQEVLRKKTHKCR